MIGLCLAEILDGPQFSKNAEKYAKPSRLITKVWETGALWVCRAGLLIQTVNDWQCRQPQVVIQLLLPPFLVIVCKLAG